MESSGVPGRVNVSASTYERVRWKFEAEEVQGVQVKGKGVMTTFLITRRVGKAGSGLGRPNVHALPAHDRGAVHHRTAASPAMIDREHAHHDHEGYGHGQAGSVASASPDPVQRQTPAAAAVAVASAEPAPPTGQRRALAS
eukprot:tig00000131_g7475.t1